MAARSLLVLLAAAAVSSAHWEAAPIEAALASDDHCADDDAVDGACALNAMQLRGAVEAGEKEQTSWGTRRRQHHGAHHHHAAFGHHDISSANLKDFRGVLKTSVDRAKNLTKLLDGLESYTNETYRMLVPQGPNVIKHYGGHTHHHSHLKKAALAQESVGVGRRRRRGLAARAGTVQDWMDGLQKILDTEWRRQTRVSRLNQWVQMKLKDPKTPPFQEQLQMKSVNDGTTDALPEDEGEKKLGKEDDSDNEAASAGRGAADALEKDLDKSLTDGTSDGEEEGEEAEPTDAGENMEDSQVHLTDDNPMEAHMEGQMDEMDKELGELGDMIELSQRTADETRGLVVQALRKNATEESVAEDSATEENATKA